MVSSETGASGGRLGKIAPLRDSAMGTASARVIHVAADFPLI
jgi:hypothetical protein